MRKKGVRARPKHISKGKSTDAKKTIKPVNIKESLDHLIHQKEEIETLLGSLEDSYNEAAITEEDYQHVKEMNDKKLGEINKKIEKLKASGVEEKLKPKPVSVAAPPTVAYPVPEMPSLLPKVKPVAVAKKVVTQVRKPVATAATRVATGAGDMKKVMQDMEARIKQSVKEVMEAAKVVDSGKEMKQAIIKLEKFEIDMEKLKAVVETVKEQRNVFDEKIQRVTEGMAELRSVVYQREAAVKDQEIKVGKLVDSISQVEPEKIAMSLKRRDKIVSDQGIEIEKMARTIEALNETMTRVRNVLVNLGSLENVVNVSKTVNDHLQSMQTIRENIEKSSDRIQSIYVELSERMEEFLLYRTKQDRMEDLTNELMRNVDEMNTKIARFITKDDLDAFRRSFTATSASGGGGAAAPMTDLDELEIEKEEIKMLLKTLEDEYRSKTVSKEEFESTKKANEEKLKEIEIKIKAAQSGQSVPQQPAAAPVPEVSGVPPEAPKAEVSETRVQASPPTSEKDKKKKKEALLKDLEDTFKKGFISKDAYERTKKMILSGKG